MLLQIIKCISSQSLVICEQQILQCHFEVQINGCCLGKFFFFFWEQQTRLSIVYVILAYTYWNLRWFYSLCELSWNSSRVLLIIAFFVDTLRQILLMNSMICLEGSSVVPHNWEFNVDPLYLYQYTCLYRGHFLQNVFSSLFVYTMLWAPE